MPVTARLTRHAWLLLVTGLLAGALGLAMQHSGAHHQDLYTSFQDCVQHETNAPVCLLDGRDSGASSASEYKANFENQLMIGRVLIVIGAAAVLAAAVGFVLRKGSRRVVVQLPV